MESAPDTDANLFPTTLSFQSSSRTRSPVQTQSSTAPQVHVEYLINPLRVPSEQQHEASPHRRAAPASTAQPLSARGIASSDPGHPCGAVAIGRLQVPRTEQRKALVL
ncbi:hypothetical protein CTheo_5669 [Ceratobasidium theobromae]|uniref:Uncharacterized protein n=1 Tax=Ceratobasidium theobromae TaxID=1582974 RepID=A0A5N5QHE7_9AGAM|nr:hypothetical protein CTheo_5669 [Ceratobasidium theobromae]